MKSAMSNLSGCGCSHERWARFRFSVIGPLLAAPPEWGELQEQLKSLAAKKWHHPISGQRVQFGLSTIERWFYRARNQKKDPVGALRRKIRSDHGSHPALSSNLRELLAVQYRQHHRPEVCPLTGDDVWDSDKRETKERSSISRRVPRPQECRSSAKERESLSVFFQSSPTCRG
jgi:hypothetical protein